MDVKIIFLHGELDQKFYMNQLRRFEKKVHSEYLYKLGKALYDLEQPPKAWYGKTAEFLTQSGHSVAHANFSLFIKASEGKLAIILAHG